MGTNYQQILIPIIFTHCFIDIFVSKTDIKIHHMCVLFFIATRYHFVKIPYPDESIIVSTVLNTEISTIFYVLSIYLENHLKTKSDQATKRPSDQATKRPSDQATKRPSDQATKRPSDPSCNYKQNIIYRNICILPYLQIL
jgi:hypothetical protein